MGRKPRVFFKGAIYHVIQRGNNRKYIYEEQTDKAIFLKLLKEKKNDFGYSVLYYTLMDNHYHILIETQDASIDKIMQSLNNAYAKYYNKKYNRTGSLYEGRYTATLVTDTRYLIQLIKYIAENPVRAKIVRKAAEYRWAAHLDIVGKQDGLVNIERLLSFFSTKKELALTSYLELIDSNQNTKKSDLLCSETKRKEQAFTQLELLLNSCVETDLIAYEVKSGIKTRNAVNCRREFCRKAIHGGFTIKDLSAYLGLTPYSVRCLAKQ